MRSCRLALLLGLLPLSGCCSLARLFCGPDRSAWISERRDTPENTVRTFLEAIRRDDAEVVRRCFTRGFATRHQADAMAWQVAWQRFRDEHPGLHLLGYVEPPPPQKRTPTAAAFDLEAHGVRIHLELVAEHFWQIDWRYDDGEPGRKDMPVRGWDGHARVEPIAGSESSRLAIVPVEFAHEGQERVALDAIDRMALVREWRIDALQVQPQP